MINKLCKPSSYNLMHKCDSIGIGPYLNYSNDIGIGQFLGIGAILVLFIHTALQWGFILVQCH